MKTTISKKSENKLKCICGMCNHKFDDKKCMYYQIVDSLNPDERMFKEILKIFKEENKSSNDNKRKSKQPKSK